MLSLTACPSPPPPQTPATGEGDVLLLPGSVTGQVTLTSGAGSLQVQVAEGEVSAGVYRAPLSDPPPLGLTLRGRLPLVPDAELLLARRVECSGRPVLSDPAGRLLAIDGGYVLVGGQVIGELSPAIGAGTTGPVIEQSASGTRELRAYVYADRAMTLSGKLECSVLYPDGREREGSVDINYQFRPGWNLAVQKTVTGADGEFSGEGRIQTLGKVNWSYRATALPGG